MNRGLFVVGGLLVAFSYGVVAASYEQDQGGSVLEVGEGTEIDAVIKTSDGKRWLLTIRGSLAIARLPEAPDDGGGDPGDGGDDDPPPDDVGGGLIGTLPEGAYELLKGHPAFLNARAMEEQLLRDLGLERDADGNAPTPREIEEALKRAIDG